MFRDLLQAEIKWLLALSLEEKKLLGNGCWTPGQPFPLHCFCLSGEIALVLLHIKPVCTAVHFRWTTMGSRFYKDLLRPWCEKYQLKEHGFDWELTPSDAAYYESATGRQSFGSSAMFMDTNNAQAELVTDVFHRTTHGALTEELRLCFGYPSSVESAGSYKQCSKIYYQFQNPEQLFASNKDDICSPCLEYDAKSGDGKSVGLHFHECRQALLTYGISIALDIDQQGKWSNEAIAETWWAAAGADLQSWIDLVNKDVLWNRLPLETGRYETIRQLMKHQQQG
mmetsp:Transcript_30118/g.34314  ORF Transcript_30118/g.34314 Transcript_30118/m.34314 type:complete len:283 (+) Transcript_30118:2-850(+)